MGHHAIEGIALIILCDYCNKEKPLDKEWGHVLIYDGKGGVQAQLDCCEECLLQKVYPQKQEA
jgi:hypothetical protein